MKKIPLFLLLCSNFCWAQTYITNVTITDVEKKKFLPNQTVIINGDVISEIKSGKVNVPEKATPEELIQRQLNAYNFRNFEVFLDTYVDDVEVYIFPDKLDYKGKDKMHAIYANMFQKTPDSHCEILGRIVDNHIIIDKESVRFNGKTMEGKAIYVVEKGKIKKVYFTP